MERLLAKNGKMVMYFIGAQSSPYYKSDAFVAVLNFVQQQVISCRFNEKNNKLSLVFEKVTNVMQLANNVKKMWELLKEQEI